MTPPPTIPQITLDRIEDLDAANLERLLRFVRERLGRERLQQITNENTMSVRLPMQTCDEVKRLALHFNTTRSRIVRQAVAEFVARHR